MSLDSVIFGRTHPGRGPGQVEEGIYATVFDGEVTSTAWGASRRAAARRARRQIRRYRRAHQIDSDTQGAP